MSEYKERNVSRAVGVKLLWKKNTPSTSIVLRSQSYQPRRTRWVNAALHQWGPEEEEAEA